MTFTIRAATAYDAELVARLNKPIHDLHVQARPDFFKPYVLDDAMLRFFRERLEDPSWLTLVGFVNDEPAGYVMVQTVRRPETPFAFAAEYIVIDQLSINPEHQHNGYGTALIDAVFETARAIGITYFVITVWAFNLDAVRFYEKLGFAARDYRMEFILPTE